MSHRFVICAMASWGMGKPGSPQSLTPHPRSRLGRVDAWTSKLSVRFVNCAMTSVVLGHRGANMFTVTHLASTE
jgi:hypothetical protein